MNNMPAISGPSDIAQQAHSYLSTHSNHELATFTAHAPFVIPGLECGADRLANSVMPIHS
jgi:hypothetical protein